MKNKTVTKDTPDISGLIADCEKILQSVEILYETHKSKDVYDAIITLEQTIESLKLA